MSDPAESEVTKGKARKAKDDVKASDKHFADASTTVEQIVEWDAKGDQVFFTEDTVNIPDDVLKELSQITRIKYQQALEIRSRLAKVDPEWDAITKNLKISQSAYASPTDIAFGNKARGGLHAKIVREDRTGYWANKGYVIAKPEHMVDAKMRQVEGHYEHGSIGSPKEYLMVTTTENRDRLMNEREERRTRIDEAQVENIKRKVRDSGLSAEDAG